MTFQPRFFRHFAGLLLGAWLLLAGSVSAQSSTTPKRDVLREITDVVGLKPRFELQATSAVQNAAAVVYSGKRFLLYNPDFVAAVNRAGRSDWAGISILAHEMGHHLNGHTLKPGGSNPTDELEADEFSGFVLRKMGASLAEAQAGMAVVSDEEASPTHPGRSTRLKAISDGWQRASQQIAASNHATAPSAAPAIVSNTPAVLPGRTNSGAGTPVVMASNGQMSLVGKITFRNKPNQPFYLTNRLNVIRLDHEEHTAQVVGRITRSNNEDFPFILVDEQNRRLLIDAAGAVYDSNGRQVAMVSDPS
ncbi:membrane-binding protein [Hymenobacter volaticus]|uniref:Membrane-binding protein n=1 Tax=Hymenobacter volaticus TaxID=2932254 RepID=A0ABY4G165_9BACT|nr:membrane-binding protein [Hymenobacter volaticus]UOQ64605.1 membrane-binding protein [Hymenobacter volaticus]